LCCVVGALGGNDRGNPRGNPLTLGMGRVCMLGSVGDTHGPPLWAKRLSYERGLSFLACRWTLKADKQPSTSGLAPYVGRGKESAEAVFQQRMQPNSIATACNLGMPTAIDATV
jgi:hypothetical protein